MDSAFDICLRNRQNLVHFIDSLSVEQLNTIPEKFNNNIIWNIAHTISVHQGLVYGLSNLKFKVEKDFVKDFTRGTKPENDLSKERIGQIKEWLISTAKDTETDYNSGNFNAYKDFQVGLGNTLTSVEDAISFNNYHEAIHLGAIMALKKFV